MHPAAKIQNKRPRLVVEKTAQNEQDALKAQLQVVAPWMLSMAK